MHDNFQALSQEKQDRILNAALQEFAVKGYKQASTNAIVSRAEISKGALFHYFPSKQALFEFLVHYSFHTLKTELYAKIEDMGTDPFEKWSRLAFLKLQMFHRYPAITTFVFSVYKDEDPFVRQLMNQEYGQAVAEMSHQLLAQVDTSRFKPGIDVAKALQIIWWTLEGFGAEEQKRLSSLDKLDETYMAEAVARMNAYLDILKAAFYKEGSHGTHTDH